MQVRAYEHGYTIMAARHGSAIQCRSDHREYGKEAPEAYCMAHLMECVMQGLHWESIVEAPALLGHACRFVCVDVVAHVVMASYLHGHNRAQLPRPIRKRRQCMSVSVTSFSCKPPLRETADALCPLCRGAPVTML